MWDCNVNAFNPVFEWNWNGNLLVLHDNLLSKCGRYYFGHLDVGEKAKKGNRGKKAQKNKKIITCNLVSEKPLGIKWVKFSK